MTLFFNFLIKSNLYISLAASFLYLYYALLMQRNFFLTTPLLVFCLTFIAYTLVRFIPFLKKSPIEHNYTDWFIQHQMFTWSSLALTTLVAIFCFIDLTLLQLGVLLIATILTLLYEKILFSFAGLRTVHFLKPFVIATAWSLTTTGLLIENSTDLIFMFDSFCFILILCILYDIKDADYDLSHGIKTLSNQLKTKTLSYILFLAFGSYLIYHICFFTETINLFLVLQITFFVLAIIVINNKKKPRSILFIALVDGIIYFKSFALVDYLLL